MEMIRHENAGQYFWKSHLKPSPEIYARLSVKKRFERPVSFGNKMIEIHPQEESNLRAPL
jgi:hypothetical protein